MERERFSSNGLDFAYVQYYTRSVQYSSRVRENDPTQK